jgi:hypothetical protein
MMFFLFVMILALGLAVSPFFFLLWIAWVALIVWATPPRRW